MSVIKIDFSLKVNVILTISNPLFHIHNFVLYNSQNEVLNSITNRVELETSSTSEIIEQINAKKKRYIEEEMIRF